MDTERESLLKSDGSLGMEFAPDTPIFAPSRENLIRFEEEDPEGDLISFVEGAELENGLGLLDRLLARWAQNQESIVIQMRNLADGLDEMQHNCNISTTVGSSVGILGGIATIAGIIVFPPLAIGGVIVGVTAAVSNTTTDVVKAVISKNKWKQVEDMITRDEQLLRDVLTQVERVERLAERSGFSFTEAPFFKMCASAGAAGATGVSGILARVVAVEAAHLAPNLAKGFAHAAAGIGIGLDALTLILAAKDMSNGSRSELAAKLRQIAGEAEAKRRELLRNGEQFLIERRAM